VSAAGPGTHTRGMSIRTPHTHPSGPEVVAGLVNDGSAAAVAAEAVHLANLHEASIRFVQVVPTALDSFERADAETATFAAGLHALHHGRHRGATFESPVGDPGRLLVDRSAKAIALVIGEDRATGPDAPIGTGDAAAVSAYCVAHARCPVHVVRRPNGATPSSERPVAGLTG
jgi:hypothetical protein